MSDFRYVLRALRHNPTFTLAAVATLALSIGATTAIFSTVNGILLRPLPFPQSDRLVLLCERHPSVAGFCIGSPPDAADWAAQSHSLEAVGIARDWPFVAKDEHGSDYVSGGIASAGFFRVLGIKPALGRLLAPGDEGGERVVVLSHVLWQSRFGGDPRAVGRTMTLDGAPYTVVGVLPANLVLPQLANIALWAPLPFDQRLEDNRNWRGFKVYGRLAPGVSLARAQDELNRIALGLAEQHPATNRGWTVSVTDLRAQVVGSVQRALYVLLGAVGFVLLIGCANVANLLLGRITHRGRELAVRAALGAGRWAALRLVLCESLVLAGLGGGAGFLLSFWGLAAFLRLAPGGIPRVHEVTMDGRVLAFAIGISLLASLLFGAAGFARAARLNLGEALHGRDVAPAGQVGVRGTLVIAETALALMLLTGAGLLLKSFSRLAQWNPGFDVAHLTTTWLLAPDAKYTTRAQVAALWERAADEMRTLPGVVSVGEASAGPLFGGTETGSFRVVGRAAGMVDSATARWYDVGADYFATLGIPLLRGRAFAPSDVAGAPGVAIINDAMARRYWPGQNPLGQQVVMQERTMTIVGIVGDVKPPNPDAAARPEIYWPNVQAARLATYMILRTAGDPVSIERAARRRLEALDPDLSVPAFQTLDARFARTLVYPRFVTLLMVTFAAIALLLAAVGVYGVIAYGVARRTREIGIQMALGATRGTVVRRFVRQGMVLAVTGAVFGAAGAVAITPVLRGLLAGVEPGDPVTFLGVAVVLVVVALAASYVPARRASGVSAMEALRSE